MGGRDVNEAGASSGQGLARSPLGARLARLGRIARDGLPAGCVILNFHRVAEPAGRRDHWQPTVTPDAFERAVRFLARRYDVIRLDELVALREPHGRARLAAVTFDDVPAGFSECALPVLRAHGVPATLFVCASLAEHGLGWREKVYLIEECGLVDEAVARVEARFGADEAARAVRLGWRSWSKGDSIPPEVLIAELVEPLLEQRAPGALAELERQRFYLSWDELRELAADPLLAIGNHGSRHYDWAGLDIGAVAADVREGEEAIAARLGVRATLLAPPFGGLPGALWLTAFELEPALARYRGVFWIRPRVNPLGDGRLRPRHWVRVHATGRFGARSRVSTLALERADGIMNPQAEERAPAGTARLTSAVTPESVRVLYRIVRPFVPEHQRDDYHAWLYDENPFRPQGMPAHYALANGPGLEAIGSAVGVPLWVGGVETPAAMFSGWRRLPRVHHPLGAAPVLAAFLAHRAPLLCYDPSASARGAFEGRGWIRLAATRFMARRVRPRELGSKRVTYVDLAVAADARACADDLDLLWARIRTAFDLALVRSARFFAWKFDRNPLGRYAYAIGRVGGDPRCCVVLGREDALVHVADVLYDPTRADSRDAVAATVRGALAGAYREQPFDAILAETNDPVVAAALRGAGLDRTGETVRFLRLPPSSGSSPPARPYLSLADADYGVRPPSP